MLMVIMAANFECILHLWNKGINAVEKGSLVPSVEAKLRSLANRHRKSRQWITPAISRTSQLEWGETL